MKIWRKVTVSASFGRFAQNYAKAVPFCKISIPGNQVKIRYFLQSVRQAQPFSTVALYIQGLRFIKLENLFRVKQRK